MRFGRVFARIPQAFLLLVLLSWPANSQATQAEQTTGAPLPRDVMLVLDNSGSMKANDPKFLMRDVVTSFSEQFTPDSRLGLVVFDEKAELALGLRDVGEADFKEQIIKALERLDYRGQRTNLPAGVERAIYELRQLGRPQAKKIIVFFTDGIVDMGSEPRNLEQALWLRETLAQEARALGIRIFGIAFTEAADFQLIQSVSQSTGGGYFRVMVASDIPRTFAQIGVRLRETDEATQPPDRKAEPLAAAVPARWQTWLLIALGLIALISFGLIARRYAQRGKPEVSIPLATLSALGSGTLDKAYPLKKAAVRIGRDEKTNDIVIAHDTVSAQHAVIEFRDASFYLKDLRSSNGTFLNGRRFSDPGSVREVVLKHRDHIRFDTYEFEFELASLAQTGESGAADRPLPGGGTRLRVEPPAATPGAPAGGLKPLEFKVEVETEVKTRVKPDMCPNHPAWKATELCSLCKVAKCKTCVTDTDGPSLCGECKKKHNI